MGVSLVVDVATHRSSTAAPPLPAPDGASPSRVAVRSASPTTKAVQVGGVRVVGLGDSVMAGANCECDDYLTGLGRLLSVRDHRPVSVTNDGRSGVTAADLDAGLSDDPALRRDVASADIVVLTVGANDLVDNVGVWRQGECRHSCYQPDIDAMAAHVAHLIETIKIIRRQPLTQIVLTDYWNVFADGDVAERTENDGYLDWSDRVTRATNTALFRAVREAGITGVDLYAPFKPDASANPTHLLADDGDHPSPAGTALISTTVLRSIKPLG